MKNKELNSSSSNLDTEFGEVLKKKERHIVSWSQEEDDILREQIYLHGSENWGIIASKFKDKTTRQCRRRWFTYLNSDFKKGGWLPEEDMLLCEAQRVYGNRWTEIAKVVSGRTDNAVKNRFTTLCKKRAKREALAKENSTTSYVNLNNKRVVFRNGLDSNEGSENALKKRTCISTIAENCKGGENIDHMKEESVVKCVGSEFAQTFLRKDDPKVLALLQQAELLSSLAIKVKAEKTDQSLENAWMVLQDFLKQSKESQQLLKITNVDADFHLEKFKALEEGIRSSDEGSRSSRREVEVYESSPASSEYSTGWTVVSIVPRDERGECEEETAALHQEKKDKHCVSVTSTENEAKNMSAFEETHVKKGDKDEFSSPTHVTPLFRALAATIPSPKFSESEKHFLMKTLGLESSSQSTVANPSQAPSCKRSLLHCL
ncbi:transcription factor MYB124-like isoform X1 [Salvia splendens]|uniref:transcription factor MYB124-like isoform X1 n=1 Tax=Salvia splendens TaxID=180675 RepID=UPI001C2734C6|nr:transcription factor MYB124-like isoform X1 [Salvia splendens]